MRSCPRIDIWKANFTAIRDDVFFAKADIVSNLGHKSVTIWDKTFLFFLFTSLKVVWSQSALSTFCQRDRKREGGRKRERERVWMCVRNLCIFLCEESLSDWNTQVKPFITFRFHTSWVQYSSHQHQSVAFQHQKRTRSTALRERKTDTDERSTEGGPGFDYKSLATPLTHTNWIRPCTAYHTSPRIRELSQFNALRFPSTNTKTACTVTSKSHCLQVWMNPFGRNSKNTILAKS